MGKPDEVLGLAGVIPLGAKGGAKGGSLPPAIKEDLVGRGEIEVDLAGGGKSDGFHSLRY